MTRTDTYHTQRVVTYQAAYHAPDITLCAQHAEQPPYPLGPVQHGQHEGLCEVCAGTDED